MTKTLLFLLIMAFYQQTYMAMNKAQAIESIYAIEKAFNDYLKSEGAMEAFLHYADEQAVLNRGNQIIKGKAAIRAYFESSTLVIKSLNWTPEFVDVSDDFSMAYSYGPYQIILLQPDGKEKAGQGIFHTVWKKQADGSWRYVYD